MSEKAKLSREQIEELRHTWQIQGRLIGGVDALCDMALRTMVAEEWADDSKHVEAAKDIAEAYEAMKKEKERLEDLVYVPGLWRCAKCKLTMASQTLYVNAGEIGPNKKPQQCPNNCGPLWRVTEREAGNELADRLNDVRNSVLEQAAIIAEAYAAKPAATVIHFLGRIAEDIQEADLTPKRIAAWHIARLIRALKGPA